MLTDICINNFGLFESLELPIESGLCILTGASGSGKSILIEAIAFMVQPGGNVWELSSWMSTK